MEHHTSYQQQRALRPTRNSLFLFFSYYFCSYSRILLFLTNFNTTTKKSQRGIKKCTYQNSQIMIGPGLVAKPTLGPRQIARCTSISMGYTSDDPSLAKGFWLSQTLRTTTPLYIYTCTLLSYFYLVFKNFSFSVSWGCPHLGVKILLVSEPAAF